jgi:hypothetical protein
MKRIPVYFIFACLVACKKQPARPPQASIPAKHEMQVDKKGWGGDVRLSLINVEQPSPWLKRYTVLSTYKGKDVGFVMQTAANQGNIHGFYKNNLILQGLGDTTNNFIAALAALYNQPMTHARFPGKIKAGYVDLHEINAFVGGYNEPPGEQRMKLFLDDDSAELYVTINEQEGWLDVLEKDPEIRPQVLKALSAGGSQTIK